MRRRYWPLVALLYVVGAFLVWPRTIYRRRRGPRFMSRRPNGRDRFLDTPDPTPRFDGADQIDWHEDDERRAA